jgi:hypothetical protein
MFYSFLVGLAAAIIIALISFINGDWFLVLKYSGAVALICFLISSTLIGSNLSGDRLRANFYSEDKHDRERRWKWSNVFLLVALPNVLSVLIVVFVYYF